MRRSHLRRRYPLKLCGSTETLRHPPQRLVYADPRTIRSVGTTITTLHRIDAHAQFAGLGTRLTTGRVAEAPDQDFTLVSSGEPALFSLRLINAALTETDVDMTIDIAGQAFSIVRKRHPLWS